MKTILNKIFLVTVGMSISLIIFLVLRIDKLEVLIKEVNDHYSSILNAVSTLILVAVTLIYVIITYFIAKASSESVKETQKQLSLSKVPVLTAEITETNGTEYFGDNRRQLHIDLKVKNIGDGPAIQSYVKMKMKYKYVEFDNYDEPFEYTFIGNVSVEEEKRAVLHFETTKIEKMIEDLSIRHAKNIYRIKNNPNQSAFLGPEISLELIYSNVHGQFFKSTIVNEILALNAYNRKNKDDRYVYWFSENLIKNDEVFKLMFKNPIFQTNEFCAIDKIDAYKFIEKYKDLYKYPQTL